MTKTVYGLKEFSDLLNTDFVCYQHINKTNYVNVEEAVQELEDGLNNGYHVALLVNKLDSIKTYQVIELTTDWEVIHEHLNDFGETEPLYGTKDMKIELHSKEDLTQLLKT